MQTHADVTPEEIAELEANHAKCPVCHAVFRSMDIMRVHLRRHQVRYILSRIFVSDYREVVTYYGNPFQHPFTGPEKYNTKCASAIYDGNIGSRFGSAFNSGNNY